MLCCSRMTINAQAQLEYLILLAIISAVIIWVYEHRHSDMGNRIADRMHNIGLAVNVPSD